MIDSKISSAELTRRIQEHEAHHHEENIECGTNELYEYREEIRKQLGLPKPQPYKKAANPCFSSICDEPAFNQNISSVFRVINVAVIVVNTNVDLAKVHTMLNQMNKDFWSANIGFKLEVVSFVSHQFAGNNCIRPYSSDYWYTDITTIKQLYSYGFAPGQIPTLNIFVSCQQTGTSGTLLGIATFPWTSNAGDPTGGLWMNENAFDTSVATLSHEIGHCLGLWHTFHGVSEVSCSSQCYEIPHPVNNYNDIQIYNDYGDLSGDTASTPTNYYCYDPSGTDCRSPPIPWTQYGTQPDNIMSYARYDRDGRQVKCRQIFSPQQMNRMRCYITNSVISKWLCLGSDCDATVQPTKVKINYIKQK